MIYCDIIRAGKKVTIKWTTNFNPDSQADVIKHASTMHYDAHRLADQILDSDKVLSLQADGWELEYIKYLFTGIPMCERPSVTWHSDMANFIARNL